MFNDNTPNQYSLSSQTSFTHLKLWPCGRQMVQYISWSQNHSNKSALLSSLHGVFILYVFLSQPCGLLPSGMNCTWHQYIGLLISLLVFFWTLNLLYLTLLYSSFSTLLLSFSYLLTTLSSLMSFLVLFLFFLISSSSSLQTLLLFLLFLSF